MATRTLIVTAFVALASNGCVIQRPTGIECKLDKYTQWADFYSSWIRRHIQ